MVKVKVMMSINMWCQVLLLSLSIIVLQSSTASCASSVMNENGEKMRVRSMITTIDQYIDSEPGKVTRIPITDLTMPKGHVGIKSLDAEIVDEEGKSVPLTEIYLHHWFLLRYYENITIAKKPEKYRIKGFEGIDFAGNSGACKGGILAHLWGFGAESRGTNSSIPDPFAIELGSIRKGFEQKFLVDLMLVDVRGTEDPKNCTECRCKAFGVPDEDLFSKKGIDEKNLTSDYKGGIFCCEPKYQCKLKSSSFQKKKITLRYKVTWVDWNKHLVPLRVYILDVAMRMVNNGTHSMPVCMSEYDIPEKGEGEGEGEGLYHIKRNEIQMEEGGYLIYGTAHVHAGGVSATLKGGDGRVICAVEGREGNGTEPGNEKDYLVGISACYPKPGTAKVNNNEKITIEFKYKSGFRTGVMGHFYMYLADTIPKGPHDNSVKTCKAD